MPEQRKVVKSNPSLLQKWFGSEELSPETQRGIDIARAEDPTLGKVEPYGLLSRLLQSSAQGYTSPGRNIYLNSSQMQGQNPNEVANTVLHEQQHVKQMDSRNMNSVREFLHEAFGSQGLPYNQRPDEMEAFDVEKKRNARLGLLAPATPSFLTGESKMPMDVYLKKEKQNVKRQVR